MIYLQLKPKKCLTKNGRIYDYYRSVCSNQPTPASIGERLLALVIDYS